MFKDFAALLQQLMNYVVGQGAKPTDFNPGSIWRTLLEGCAALVEECYNLLARMLRMFWFRTATGEWLDFRAADFGKTRKPGDIAEGSILIGRNTPAPFGILVPKGTTFEVSGIRYVTDEDGTIFVNTSSVEVKAKAVAIGSIYNKPADTILQQVGEGVTGVEWAKIKVMKNGADVESDDDFRSRVLDWLRNPGTSGNNADYRQWAMDVEDVTGAKVIPTWNGPGTVKVVILGPGKKPPFAALVALVQNKIAPADESSETRLAPIGATVTVAGAEAVAINLDAHILLDATVTVSLAAIQEAYILALNTYLSNMALKADTVRYSRVGSLLIEQVGVLDLIEYTLNGAKENISIKDSQVAVIGTVTLHVG